MKRFNEGPRFGPPSRGFGGPNLPPRGFGGGRGFGLPPRPFGPSRFMPDEDYDEYGPPARFPRHSFRDDLPMSPFLKKMLDEPLDFDEPRGIPRKEEILMDLGQSVYASLKQGKKLSENPDIREKLETLLQVEAGGPSRPPLPTGGPHSRYDEFYEHEFMPPGAGPMGPPARFPRPMGPPGFGPMRGPPAFNGPPMRGPFGFPGPRGGVPYPSTDKLWYKFSRTGDERDHHRIYATQRELDEFFVMKKTKAPLKLSSVVRERLRNSFAYEIAQCKNEKRKAFLTAMYNKIKKDSDVPFKLDPESRNKEADRRRSKRDSANRKMKKLMRDKRPPQTRDERTIVNYLKFMLFDLCGDEGKEHVVLFLRAIQLNPNMIKCLMTECKTFLDKKFGAEQDLETRNKRRAYLIAIQQKHMEDTRRTLLSVNKIQAAKEINDIVYVKYNEHLSGDKNNSEEFATPEDYVIEPQKSQEEFIVDFKYEFVRFAFEKFYFKVVETFCVTNDRRKRINFFMNNGFLAGLIVQAGQGMAYKLPSEALKYITFMDRPCREASERIDGKLLAKAMTMADTVVETDPSEFTNGKGLTMEVLQLFNQCVKLFDVKATVVKFQLVDYTPYIPLTREHKQYVFGEIMKFVYLQCLANISSGVDFLTKQYAEMEKDPVSKVEPSSQQ